MKRYSFIVLGILLCAFSSLACARKNEPRWNADEFKKRLNLNDGGSAAASAPRAMVTPALAAAGNGQSAPPECMWGPDDPLCQSYRLQEELQRKSRGNKSGGLDDECIYNPDAGNCAEMWANDLADKFRKSFDDRYANPYSLDYDPTKDRCILDPNCDMTAKGITHYNWLYNQCVRGNNAACRKLKAGAPTPAPKKRDYPPIPYYPGTEPVRQH